MRGATQLKLAAALSFAEFTKNPVVMQREKPASLFSQLVTSLLIN
jgi:hypothetical protein